MYFKNSNSFAIILCIILSFVLSCGSAGLTGIAPHVDMKIDLSKKIIPNCIDSPTGKGGPMCEVPAGAFWRGCNRLDFQCSLKEKPYRNIYLDTFYIDRHEVTVNEYKTCVKNGSCSDENLTSPLWDIGPKPERSKFCNWGNKDKGNHPINCISWTAAREYCKWVGKSLPTEAQWEKAARGVDGRIYPWGNQGYDVVTLPLVANIPDLTASEYFNRKADFSSDPEYYSHVYDDGYYLTSPVEFFWLSCIESG